MDLIPRRIARVGKVLPRQEIRVRNSSDAKVVVDVDGTEWVHKELMGAGQVLAEAVSFLLATRLALPVPTGGVARDHYGSPSWLSALIHNPAHWNANIFESIEHGERTIGTMYVVDVIVANEDRHDGNVLLEHTGQGVRRPWYIDFANAQIGDPRGLLTQPDFVPDPRGAHFRPAPLSEAVTSAAHVAAAHASAIPTQCLAADAHEACDAAGCSELANVLYDVLVYRCGAISATLTTYLKALRGS
jgi:hypothetical protein